MGSVRRSDTHNDARQIVTYVSADLIFVADFNLEENGTSVVKQMTTDGPDTFGDGLWCFLTASHRATPRLANPAMALRCPASTAEIVPLNGLVHIEQGSRGTLATHTSRPNPLFRAQGRVAADRW
jgi:hypothetical protein